MMQSKRTIIGICGAAGSGKSTLANLLAERHGFSVEALADPLKAICAQVFGFSMAQLFGPSENRNAPDPRWDGLTPRRALQTLGTEWGRAMHQDVWVRLVLTSLEEPDAPKLIAIPDVRFQNEVDAIRKTGGKIVMISGRGGLAGAPSEHASEQSDTLTGIDFWIDNSSTIEFLTQAADALVLEVLSP